MDIQVLYTEIQENQSTLRMGGLILKGQARQTRQPIHLILLIDTSGSMDSSEKLISVKKSIQLMLSFLSQEDRISLVSFADHSKCILSQAVPSVDQLQAIQYRIDSLRADGSTNMSAALLEGRRLVESASQRKQGMILLTDGHANIGVKDTTGLLDILERIHTEYPSLTASTVAYGVDHNTNLLSSLAQTGGGGYNVVSSAEDVASVFGNILGGLVSISCQKLEVLLPPGCVPMTSFPFTSTDKGTLITIGDLYAETELTLMFKHSPSLDPIQIKGVDMLTLNEIHLSVQPSSISGSSDVPISLLMAQYCLRVSDLLKMVSNPGGITPTLLSDLMNTLLREIRENTRVLSHPLRDMLIQDMEHAIQLVENRSTITQEDTVLLAQHSAYIGLSRGMPSLGPEDLQSPPRLRRQRRHNGFDSADHIMTSPFANALQTHYSEMMISLVNQNEEEPQNLL